MVMIPRGASRNNRRESGGHRRGLPTQIAQKQCAVPEQGGHFVFHCFLNNTLLVCMDACAVFK